MNYVDKHFRLRGLRNAYPVGSRDWLNLDKAAKIALDVHFGHVRLPWLSKLIVWCALRAYP